jgi:SepF-like predicted cell division protein (DUF552 family)
MGGFLEKLKFIRRSSEDDYVEIDASQFENASGSSQIMLRMADLAKIEIMPEIQQEIYNGNIVLVDIGRIKRDKTALDKAIAELKKTVEEVSGDIAGIGDDLVAVVPDGIKIDRENIVGAKD